MRLLRFLLAGAVVTAASCSFACSSSSDDPFGPDPDFASIQQRLRAPDGTLAHADARALFVRWAEQHSAQESADVGATRGTSAAEPSGGTRTRALRLLDLAKTGSPSSSCSALEHGDAVGSCDCPSGGSFRYDFSEARALSNGSGSVDVTLRLRFDACSGGDASIDGREYLRLHVDRASSGSSAREDSLSMLLVLDATVKAHGATHTLDLAASFDDGRLAIALQVDDGWVVVEGDETSDGKNGTFVVKDREGTWTCVAKDGAGTCTSDSGQTRSF